MTDLVTDAVSFTFAQMQEFAKARTYRLRLGLAVTSRALLEERTRVEYLTKERDRLAAENSVLRAQIRWPHHVRPHER